MTYKPHNPQKFTPFLRIIIDKNFILLLHNPILNSFSHLNYATKYFGNAKSDATMTKSKTKCGNFFFFFFFLPLGGQGNSYSTCPSASCMTRESFALPSHPKCTYVNRMSKLHAHIMFWVISLRLSLNAVVLPDGAEALMCVPSIAPTHFC